MYHTVLYPVHTTLRIGALVEWTSIHEQYTLKGSAVGHHLAARDILILFARDYPKWFCGCGSLE